MKELPKLDRDELNKWCKKILGENSNKFPHSFLFEQLFFERSPLSKGRLFSGRLELLKNKFKDANVSEGLAEIFPNILKYLRDNDYLDEKSYEEEYDRCVSLLEK